MTEEGMKQRESGKVLDRIKSRLLIDSQGNHRFDLEHPKATVRLKTAELVLDPHKHQVRGSFIERLRRDPFQFRLPLKPSRV